jgi:fatty acid desaturase
MQPPSPSAYRRLRPSNRLAWLHVAINVLLIGGGLALASDGSHPVLYIGGQVLLALGFTHAFVLLHEAGHLTLFRQRWLNYTFGQLAGFLALIPYATWRPVHARHHRYTGWQDLDSTTASLVPRQLSRIESVIIDGAWRFWLPLFSVVYRVQNYWRIGRIGQFLGSSAALLPLRLAATAQLLCYMLLTAWIGLPEALILVGPGLFLALMAQDLLLLSQHTGMPSNLSEGGAVRPYPPQEQAQFTRSLRLPDWLSWLLLHFDAHELHHLYPAVPSYLLRRIPYDPPNEIGILTWLREVKAMSGTRFLFGGQHVSKEDI